MSQARDRQPLVSVTRERGRGSRGERGKGGEERGRKRVGLDKWPHK